MTKYLVVLLAAAGLIVALHLVGLANKDAQARMDRFDGRATAIEAELIGLASKLGGTIGALRMAENRITALELRVAKLEVKPKPEKPRPVPVFARCGRTGC